MKYIELIILLILISLGTWQCYRWQHKRVIESRIQASSMDSFKNTNEIEEYTKITFRCALSTEALIYMYAGKKGSYVLTTCEVKKGEYVLINIGTAIERKKIKITKGIYDITGILLYGVRSPVMIRSYDEKDDSWFGIDVAKISEVHQINLVPYIIWTEKTDIMEIEDNGPFAVYNHHLEYILTWYGLALVLSVYIACQRYFRRFC